MLDVRSKAEDGATKEVTAVDARAAQHDPAFFLEMAKQSLVIFIRIAMAWPVTEGDD